MSKVKKQHYVPQCYLRRFGDERERLLVYDKRLFSEKEKGPFTSPIKELSQEKYFYDIERDRLPTGINDEQFIEKKLGEIEGMLAQTLDAAISNIQNSSHLSDDLRGQMAFLVALQSMRTRKARDAFVGMVKVNDPNFDDQREAILHGTVLLGEMLPTYAAHLNANTVWMLGTNNTSTLLYTSDNPVVVYRIFMLGIEVQPYLALPLSPLHVLMMRPKHPHELEYNNTPYPLTQTDVKTLNGLQVTDSDRQIYSHPLDSAFPEYRHHDP